MNFDVPNDKIPSNINMDFIIEIRTGGGLMLKCHLSYKHWKDWQEKIFG